MAICHKCGSEIAEDTVFCPFCGVSIESVVDADIDPAEFDNTLNMPFAEAEKLKADIVVESGDSQPVVPDEKVITNDIAPSEETPSADDA